MGKINLKLNFFLLIVVLIVASFGSIFLFPQKALAETATYYADWGAPRCTSGESPCDAPSSLLQCRDNVGEPNYPNTLDGCTDGTSGTCHSDESIESITVSEVGGNGAFNPGDTVQVDYHAYCYGTDDYVAVYYSNSVTNPNWVRETPTGTKCPASGYQDFSIQFTLDNNTGYHAVRAVMEYNAEISTACDSGDYNDRDDLAFNVLPSLTQNDYRWYENADNVHPGSSKAAKNTAISNVQVGDILRLRMNISVSNGDLATSSKAFKLQYAQMAGTACGGGDETWYDVDSIAGSGNGALWRGYNNATPADGATISSTLIDTSEVCESYEEENPSVDNPNGIPQNQEGEWDWAIINYAAPPSTDYCFRMVKSDGTPLNSYINYPKLTTGDKGGWVQTTKADFDAGVLNQVVTSVPGDASLNANCPDGNLIIDGGTQTLSGEKYYCTVEIKNGGTLYTTDGDILKIHAISISVDSSSSINGDGRGYNGGAEAQSCGDQNNGSGTGAGTGGYVTSGGNSNGPGGGGGGYGGTGGSGGGAWDNEDVVGTGGSTYGSDSDETIYLGSGGGAGGDSCYSGSTSYGGKGGDGGGAILLDASTINIAGTITMRGENGEDGYLGDADGVGGGGGGSGGTILIKGSSVTISGELNVSGGNGGAKAGTYGGSGGGGGGGRIKIFYESLDDTGATYNTQGGATGGATYEDPQPVAGSSGSLYKASQSYTSSVSYYSSGTLASQVHDCGIDNATWDKLSWMESLPSTTDITFEVRASDTSFAKDATTPSWIDLGSANSPITSGLPSGRYQQWRATFSTTDSSYTPTLHEALIVYSPASTVVSVSVSDGKVAYGIIPADTSKSTCTSELNDAQTVTNDGNVTENFNIRGQNSANWTLASTAGNDQYVHSFATSTCSTWPGGTALTTSDQTLATGVAPGSNITLNLQIHTPTSSSVYTQQSVDVIITAVQQ